MDKLRARLSLLEESSSVMRATIGPIDSSLNKQISKPSKVNTLRYRYIVDKLCTPIFKQLWSNERDNEGDNPIDTRYGLVILSFHYWYNVVIL